MIALLDATMSDLDDFEHNAETVYVPDFGDDYTEVNLDLAGALEEVVERETRLERRPSWVREISNLIEEEFDCGDDLPELASGEFVALPPVADLVAPPPPRLMTPLFRVPLAAVRSPQPIKIIVGRPIIAMHEEPPPSVKPDRSAFVWASAILTGAVTMLAAWVLRMGLYELIGL
jgi:hypothetical protein